MRVAVVTSMPRGIASLALPALAQRPGIDVEVVIFAAGASRGRLARYRRLLRKTRRIGVLGALNGVRLRKWYGRELAQALELEPIDELAERLGVRLETTEELNSLRTVELLRKSGAEIGLSLGNGIIAPTVFETPARGMINVHAELLPEYRGAQSVIWPIYDGRAETGYTIHQIDEKLDHGAILRREKIPIDFAPTLRETVVRSLVRSFRSAAGGLADVVEDYPGTFSRAEVQAGGRSFTTPTFRQFLRMRVNHRELAHAQGVTGQSRFD